MGLEYIRKTYNVPARRGQKVEYYGDANSQEFPRKGVITSARGAHICIRMEGEKHPGAYHPTWMLRYVSDETY